ncbi:MAG: cytochrome c-type biogenesis protein [Shewanella sp.]
MHPLFRSPYLSLFVWILSVSVCCAGSAFMATAAEQTQTALSYQQQAIEISKVLRCPMATNQSLFESQAPIAHELKAQIFTMLDQGYSQNDILDFMVERYGEKIRYQPEFKTSTLALWLGPLLLLVLGVGLCLALISRKPKSTC